MAHVMGLHVRSACHVWFWHVLGARLGYKEGPPSLSSVSTASTTSTTSLAFQGTKHHTSFRNSLDLHLLPFTHSSAPKSETWNLQAGVVPPCSSRNGLLPPLNKTRPLGDIMPNPSLAAKRHQMTSFPKIWRRSRSKPNRPFAKVSCIWRAVRYAVAIREER